MIHIDQPGQLGPAIAALRAIHGLSRAELARRIAADTGAAAETLDGQLWSWESGKHMPRLDRVVAALTVLGYRLQITPLEDS